MLADHASGRIRVAPPLNVAEREFMHHVRARSGTLRGTPTGRGDAHVPFVPLAWIPCDRGCCLTWDTSVPSRYAAPSLEFVVDHLLRPGAKATGHRRFPDFTCDHVLDGAVVVQRYDDRRPHVVCVRANVVEHLEVASGCDVPPPLRRAPRQWPANVVVLRPRRA